MKAHWPPASPTFLASSLFRPYKLPPSSSASPSSLCIPITQSSSSHSLSPALSLSLSQIMKPKDRLFNQGLYKGSSTMHVSGSFRIVSNCHSSQKEPFLGADADDDGSSSGMLLVEDTPLFF